MNKSTALIIAVFKILIVMNVNSQSVVNTVHNLSLSGPGTITATSESEICIFCHTPHSSKPASPLWNRNDPGLNFTLYNSTTTNATLGQPDGSSILCLSCHDGTVALGNVLNRATDITFGGGITTMPLGNTNLTTDISDDHPISFTYSSDLASTDGQLKDPSLITHPVSLESGKLQCVSCHDPHDDTYSHFLVATTQYSGLCISCHERDNWSSCSHQSSSATWNNSGTDPWFHTDYSTVAENACENCHNPHNAGGNDRLMKHDVNEENCLDCHNGNVAAKNIEAQVTKISSHNVYLYINDPLVGHDPTEAALRNIKHVECEDCHNPHATRNAAATAPNVNGFIEGTVGVDANGNRKEPIDYEYELCYGCHADNTYVPSWPATPRVIAQNNVRLEFDTGNPSHHAVEDPGVNNDVPSLILPLTESSVIYCTDCHASNGDSPEGPHGSIYPHILKYNYETADFTSESYSAYELCYQCHDQNSILNDNSFKDHDKHIRGEDTPCNVCHDPHGISSTQGNSTNNSHLINFNSNIVHMWNGQRRFVDKGTFSGECYLTCHGKRHDPLDY
ncbi:cytochrome c3 family protein [Bacteroidota bacterium]